MNFWEQIQGWLGGAGAAYNPPANAAAGAEPAGELLAGVASWSPDEDGQQAGSAAAAKKAERQAEADAMRKRVEEEARRAAYWSPDRLGL